MAKYGMVIDLGSCIGCGACIAACDFENETPWEEGKRRTHVPEIFLGVYPDATRLFAPRLCEHCENAPCVAVCPTGASYVNEDGVVLVNADLCIGCEYCVVACPFNARYLDTRRRVVDKCTFCYDNRVLQGRQPACVETCVGGARIFGDLEDPNSEVSRFLSSVDKNRVLNIGERYNLETKVLYVIPKSKRVKDALLSILDRRSPTNVQLASGWRDILKKAGWAGFIIALIISSGMALTHIRARKKREREVEAAGGEEA